MARNLSGVPRNALEALIHEQDRKLDRAEMLRDQAVAVCERRTAERDEAWRLWRRTAAELSGKIDRVLVILRRPGHTEDIIADARKVLEG